MTLKSKKEAKPMSKLETLIDEEQQRSDAWKEQKTAERNELNALSDEAVTRTTTEPEAYLRYLDVQADNPAYSASNVLLAAAQRPDVTVFHSLEQWNKMGRSVKAQETGIKVRVSDPYMRDGRKYYGFKIDRAFDISQTEGKDVAARLPIEEESPQMETALRKLLRLSPVPVRTSAEAEFDACYDPAAKTIFVSPGLSEAKQFAALAREVYHASAHENSRAGEYDREQYALDAESAGYMLCRSFGVPCEKPDAAKVAELYADMEPMERRDILDGIRQSFRSMQQEIVKELMPKTKTRAEQSRALRSRGMTR